MKKILLSNLILIFILLFASSIVKGQDQTIYSMRHVFQANNNNPARQHNCKVFIGLPAISSEYLSIVNTGFTYNSFFSGEQDQYGKYLVDIDKFYDDLKDINHLNIENKISLFGLGFWVRDFYFTIGVTNNFTQRFSYPKSLFDIKDGTYYDDGHPLSFTGMAEDVTLYNEFAFGISKEIIPNLTVGAKLKFLSGLINFTTHEFMFDWYTSTAEDENYPYTFNTQFDFRLAAPWNIEATIDPATGLPNGIQSEVGLTADSIAEYFKNNPKQFAFGGNPGFGIDLGAIYTINNMFTISASLIDFGFIKWKNNSQIISTDETEFEFTGLDPAQYVTNYAIAVALKDPALRDTMIENFKDDMLDTLISLSNPTFAQESYKTRLNTKMYFGFNYSPVEWFDLGLLYRGYFYKEKLHSAFTISANTNFFKGWAYTLSYTMHNGTYNNLGMGFAYKIGPLQMYLISDNLALPTFVLFENMGDKWIKNTKQATLHFGINFYFGCRERKDYGIID